MPWVMFGRSAARLSAGLAMPANAVAVAEDARVVRNRRRVSAPVEMLTAIGPPQSNHGGPCAPFLTETRTLCDDRMTHATKRWISGSQLRDGTRPRAVA